MDFSVIFYGLITIAKTKTGGDDTPRRAILVEGPGSMRHIPLLVFDNPPDDNDRKTLTTELYNWTHQTPTCPDYDFDKDGKKCSENITGADLRIRDAGGAAPLSPISYDSTRSFEKLLPSLFKLADVPGNPGRNVIKDALMKEKNLPQTPAAAFIEIDGGGKLSACPFDDGDSYDNDPGRCVQFARDTYWVGSTTQPAYLQIRSQYTPETGDHDHQWMNVDIKNSGALNLLIINEPPIGTKPTPDHFVLFDNILRGGHVPHVTGKKCTPPTVLTCSPGGVVFVPGCSDTQWP